MLSGGPSSSRSAIEFSLELVITYAVEINCLELVVSRGSAVNIHRPKLVITSTVPSSSIVVQRLRRQDPLS
ncbi:hypothetical protein MA16_Dca015322 [Dendrobium catenatum]|uniref:Uncharacterized protein n=1 Tax=Dendrobium catenatum TaxID=906689 RepID=A0A2I0W1B1_9ASPA|nr:hypothetical protein MA16_Dca015322 [Dendrobium catenatum]